MLSLSGKFAGNSRYHFAKIVSVVHWRGHNDVNLENANEPETKLLSIKYHEVAWAV